jgi:hypothetical protein
MTAVYHPEWRNTSAARTTIASRDVFTSALPKLASDGCAELARGMRGQTPERIIEFLRQGPATAGEVTNGLKLNPSSVATRVTQLAKPDDIHTAGRGHVAPGGYGSSSSRGIPDRVETADPVETARQASEVMPPPDQPNEFGPVAAHGTDARTIGTVPYLSAISCSPQGSNVLGIERKQSYFSSTISTTFRAAQARD